MLEPGHCKVHTNQNSKCRGRCMNSMATLAPLGTLSQNELNKSHQYRHAKLDMESHKRFLLNTQTHTQKCQHLSNSDSRRCRLSLGRKNQVGI